jgi:hypothetical protein
LRHLAWIALQGFGQLQRRIAGEIAVRHLLGARQFNSSARQVGADRSQRISKQIAKM